MRSRMILANIFATACTQIQELLQLSHSRQLDFFGILPVTLFFSSLGKISDVQHLRMSGSIVTNRNKHRKFHRGTIKGGGFTSFECTGDKDNFTSVWKSIPFPFPCYGGLSSAGVGTSTDCMQFRIVVKCS